MEMPPLYVWVVFAQAKDDFEDTYVVRWRRMPDPQFPTIAVVEHTITRISDGATEETREVQLYSQCADFLREWRVGEITRAAVMASLFHTAPAANSCGAIAATA